MPDTPDIPSKYGWKNSLIGNDNIDIDSFAMELECQINSVAEDTFNFRLPIDFAEFNLLESVKIIEINSTQNSNGGT